MESTQKSMLVWLYYALGPLYLVLLPLAGLVSLIVALLLVVRGKGPFVGAGLFLVVHTPLLIGIFGAVQGMIASYSVIASSPATPKPNELAAGAEQALISIPVGMLLMIPGYAVATIGAVARSLFAANDKQ
jgi:hypothetical protein